MAGWSPNWLTFDASVCVCVPVGVWVSVDLWVPVYRGTAAGFALLRRSSPDTTAAVALTRQYMAGARFPAPYQAPTPPYVFSTLQHEQSAPWLGFTRLPLHTQKKLRTRSFDVPGYGGHAAARRRHTVSDIGTNAAASFGYATPGPAVGGDESEWSSPGGHAAAHGVMHGFQPPPLVAARQRSSGSAVPGSTSMRRRSTARHPSLVSCVSTQSAPAWGASGGAAAVQATDPGGSSRNAAFGDAVAAPSTSSAMQVAESIQEHASSHTDTESDGDLTQLARGPLYATLGSQPAKTTGDVSRPPLERIVSGAPFDADVAAGGSSPLEPTKPLQQQHHHHQPRVDGMLRADGSIGVTTPIPEHTVADVPPVASPHQASTSHLAAATAPGSPAPLLVARDSAADLRNGNLQVHLRSSSIDSTPVNSPMPGGHASGGGNDGGGGSGGGGSGGDASVTTGAVIPLSPAMHSPDGVQTAAGGGKPANDDGEQPPAAMPNAAPLHVDVWTKGVPGGRPGDLFGVNSDGGEADAGGDNGGPADMTAALQNIQLDALEQVRVLGVGLFGRVSLVWHPAFPGQAFALKVRASGSCCVCVGGLGVGCR